MKFEKSLISKIMDYREAMRVDGKLNKKFIGAITVELLRKELLKEGFNVSNRDVFIDGVSHELDLLILKNGERAKENLFYNPRQVIMVFEMKFSGIYSEKDIKNINRAFNSVKKVDKKIKCVYLTISENIRHKYYSEEKKLGDFSCFLLKRDTSLKRAIDRGELKITGDWDKFIELLNKINNHSRHARAFGERSEPISRRQGSVRKRFGLCPTNTTNNKKTTRLNLVVFLCDNGLQKATQSRRL